MTWVELCTACDANPRHPGSTRCRECLAPDGNLPTIAIRNDILSTFCAELARVGVVGEDRLAKLVYLAVVSRILEQPVSIVVKGPSSAGKSYVIKKTLEFFPDTAYFELSAMSERALAYSTEPMSHRMLVLYEAAGMSGDIATYLLRTLLSEGKLKYEYVEKTKDGLKAKLIEREGPTGLLVTTTEVRLHPENETRLFSVVANDTADQTRRVLAQLAVEEAADVDLDPWHELQVWLEAGEALVTIPWAPVLAEMVPPVAVRLRRDFGSVLNLVRAHAVLHGASRGLDEAGRIVATVTDDYAVVLDLVEDLVADGVEATVSDTMRETVEAVATLTAAGATVSNVEVAHHLKLDASAMSRRVRGAIMRGYLVNDEDRKGKPAKLRVGEPLPNDVRVLPTVDELLECCSVAGVSGGVIRGSAVQAGSEGSVGIYPPESHDNTATLAAVRDLAGGAA